MELSERLFMLAERGDVKTVNLPAYAEPKLDGVRTFVEIKKGEPPRLLNRRGHLIHDRTPFHKSALPAVKSSLTNPTASAVLDGELWRINPQGKPLDFYEVLRIDKGDLIEAGGCRPKLTLFDVLEHNEKDMRAYPYFTRITLLDMMVRKGDIVAPVDTVLVRTQEETTNYFTAQIDAGFEGIMLKQPFTPYKSGRRSKTFTPSISFTFASPEKLRKRRQG